MTNKKNICIIGAGIGGLTAGALLTKNGYKVKIFEKEPFIGGRALSIDASTITLENYKKILSNYCMYLPFSEPDIEEIFDKKFSDLPSIDWKKWLNIGSREEYEELSLKLSGLSSIEDIFDKIGSEITIPGMAIVGENHDVCTIFHRF